MRYTGPLRTTLHTAVIGLALQLVTSEKSVDTSVLADDQADSLHSPPKNSRSFRLLSI